MLKGYKALTFFTYVVRSCKAVTSDVAVALHSSFQVPSRLPYDPVTVGGYTLRVILRLFSICPAVLSLNLECWPEVGACGSEVGEHAAVFHLAL